jgi:multicomponent Na+:H+ antiporter subunit A
LLFSVLAGFTFAILLLLTGKFFKGKAAIVASALPLALFVWFCSFIPEIAAGRTITQIYPWVPELGVNLSFHLDGLSLLFALMITGIGTLVFIYTGPYLKGHPFLDRFYGYLSIFMGAMLGVVLSDNLLSLFIFWELTSISSFFLIGFNNNEPASRKSALKALGITGFGGLALLAAGILMGQLAGTYSIQEILNSGVSFQTHGSYVAIIVLVFIAAFTKSAQFPFHFWLPGAMKAPTPVSTYLHSATMVKAGIYLLMRFTPMLGNDEIWNTTLIVVGGTTMVFAAFHTLFRTDLKGILAYSTIAALGILVFLIGLGTEAALLAAVVFIVVHALYKATLFLVTGILDHETGTRDITKLSGLKKVMMPVAIIGLLAAISNAGLPPAIGFIGKDLIYEATMHMGLSAILLTSMAVVTNILLLYAGFLVGIKPFFGKLPEALSNTHAPSLLLILPPALLALMGISFGIYPGWVDYSILQPALKSIIPLATSTPIKLWHGFNTALLLSGITVAAGIVLYFVLKPSQKLEVAMARLEFLAPERLILGLSAGFQMFSKFITTLLQNGYLRFYLFTILTFMVVIIGYNMLLDWKLQVNYEQLMEITFYEMAILTIMLFAIIYAVFTESRLAAVAAMGVVGYAMCLLFVFYSAPDLAMTQFTIDTLTVILFVLVLYRLPRYLSFSNTAARIRDGILALSFGAMITLLVLEVLNEPHNLETGEFYADNAYILAKGKNVVNVILVDFRGFDTLVEITVLSIAAIGVFSLIKLRNKQWDRP